MGEAGCLVDSPNPFVIKILIELVKANKKHFTMYIKLTKPFSDWHPHRAGKDELKYFTIYIKHTKSLAHQTLLRLTSSMVKKRIYWRQTQILCTKQIKSLTKPFFGIKILRLFWLVISTMGDKLKCRFRNRSHEESNYLFPDSKGTGSHIAPLGNSSWGKFKVRLFAQVGIECP